MKFSNGVPVSLGFNRTHSNNSSWLNLSGFVRQTLVRFKVVSTFLISFHHVIMEQDPVGGDDRAPHPLVNVLSEHLLGDPERYQLFLHSLVSI